MVIGWIMKNVFDAITELRRTDQDMAKEVNKLAVTLPENYVHKNDFKDFSEMLFNKLDRIEGKLDHKADKP